MGAGRRYLRGCLHYVGLHDIFKNSSMHFFIESTQYACTRACPTQCGARGVAPRGSYAPPYIAIAACRSSDLDLGVLATLEECAAAVQLAGRTFFLYGRNAEAGKCFAETTASRDCPEGWEGQDDYDFYRLAASTAVFDLTGSAASHAAATPAPCGVCKTRTHT